MTKNKKLGQTQKNIIIALSIIVLSLIISYGVVQAFSPNAIWVEGDDAEDVMGMIYCIDYGNDGVDAQLKVNDINWADTRVLRDNCYRYVYPIEIDRMVVDADVSLVNKLYTGFTTFPHAINSDGSTNTYDYVSPNAQPSRSGVEIEFNNQKGLCVENERKIYVVHTIQTLFDGVVYWTDTNSFLMENVDCCDLGDRDGDNVCVNFKWSYDPLPLCEDDGDCSDGGYIGDKVCDGNDVVQQYQEGECISAQMGCGFDTITKVIETCDFGCSYGICKDEVIIPDGEDEVIIPDGEVIDIIFDGEDGEDKVIKPSSSTTEELDYELITKYAIGVIVILLGLFLWYRNKNMPKKRR